MIQVAAWLSKVKKTQKISNKYFHFDTSSVAKKSSSSESVLLETFASKVLLLVTWEGLEGLASNRASKSSVAGCRRVVLADGNEAGVAVKWDDVTLEGLEKSSNGVLIAFSGAGTWLVVETDGYVPNAPPKGSSKVWDDAEPYETWEFWICEVLDTLASSEPNKSSSTGRDEVCFPPYTRCLMLPFLKN